MKRRTINSVLAKKFKEFCKSIDDPHTRSLVERNSIITGGCIASMLLKEHVNDYDIYFTNHETALAVAKYYAKGLSYVSVIDGHDRVKIRVISDGVAGKDAHTLSEEGDLEPDERELLGQSLEEPEEKEPYSLSFLSSNAISLTGKVQLILRFYGPVETIHENYDFIHCTNYWTPGGELVLRPDAMEALLAKELRYVGSKYPLCSMIRTRKFIRRGYTINAGQYLKMAMQVSKLDLENIDVLEEQLTGVDVTYFMHIIETLRKKTDSDRVDHTYLATIIDRLF